MRDEIADLVCDVLDQVPPSAVVAIEMNVPTMLAVLVIVDHTVETMPHHEIFADQYEDLVRLRDSLRTVARAMADPNHPIWGMSTHGGHGND